MTSASLEGCLAAEFPIKYDLPLMPLHRELPSAQLALPTRGTQACLPSPIHELLLVFLSIQLLGRFLSTAFVALDPYHEHLFIGRGRQDGLTAPGWHQHTLREPHSHSITGSVLEPPGRQGPQVISYVSNTLTQISSYFGALANEIMAPGGSIPAILPSLLLSLGLVSMAFTLRPSLPPPAPPPKPSAR